MLVEQERLLLLFIILLLIRLIPVNKVGCSGKEHTSLYYNTDLFAAPFFFSSGWVNRRISQGIDKQSWYALWQGCIWGKRTFAVFRVLWGTVSLGPAGEGKDREVSLHLIDKCSLTRRSECWEETGCHRGFLVAGFWVEASLSFSVKMSVWKISYGLCLLGYWR